MLWQEIQDVGYGCCSTTLEGFKDLDMHYKLGEKRNELDFVRCAGIRNSLFPHIVCCCAIMCFELLIKPVYLFTIFVWCCGIQVPKAYSSNCTTASCRCGVEDVLSVWLTHLSSLHENSSGHHLIISLSHYHDTLWSNGIYWLCFVPDGSLSLHHKTQLVFASPAWTSIHILSYCHCALYCCSLF